MCRRDTRPSSFKLCTSLHGIGDEYDAHCTHVYRTASIVAAICGIMKETANPALCAATKF